MITLLLMTMALAVAMVACQGAVGKTGEPGPKGEPGPAAPAVAVEIDDMTFAHDGEPQEVDLADKFRNVTADGYDAVPADAAVATASVSGTTLTVTRAGTGTTIVTVSATGNDGTKVSQSVCCVARPEPRLVAG